MLVAAIVIFCGMKLIPVKVKLFNFSDRVEQKLERASWRNYEQAHEEIIKFVRQEIDRGPITGFSVAMRVAIALKDVGIALPAGNVPDPWGKIAQERLKKTSRSG